MKKGIDNVRILREQIESTRAEMERAERAYDLNLVAELKHGKLPTLEAELEELENADKNEDAILKEEVTAEEIADIVARWTGVPVTKLIEGEREKILRLQSILHERVIGQNEAVDSVAEAIMRARAGYQRSQSPYRIILIFGTNGGREDKSLLKPWLRVFSIVRIMSLELTCLNTWKNIRLPD